MALVKNASDFIVYLASVNANQTVLNISLLKINLVFILLQIMYYIFILRVLLE
ncbi:hypothetical protein NIES4075_30370 [Tolypothrix sp. NIES-4075]|nr:hypothetical protein NIES4075_30370 [Tolypothrix sp. NIES-4075]